MFSQTLYEISQQRAMLKPDLASSSILPPSPDSAGNQIIPIHYNHAVILQCQSTGMISPIMFVRKVEKGSLVVGSINTATGEEILGDPVSQLHKIAFELAQKPPVINSPNNIACGASQHPMFSPDYMPSTAASNAATAMFVSPTGPNMRRHSFAPGTKTNMRGRITTYLETNGTYLSCSNNVVGLHQTADGKKLVDAAGGGVSVNYRVNHGNSNDPAIPYPQPGLNNDWHNPNDFMGTLHMGAGIHHHMIRTASVSGPSGSRPKQRNNSISSHPNDMDPSSPTADSMSTVTWCEDVTDSAVWTIVGTDISQFILCDQHGHNCPSNLPFNSNLSSSESSLGNYNPDSQK